MRRIIYMMEAGLRLLCPLHETYHVRKLADGFWCSFPLWDVDRAYAYLRMINLSHWCWDEWSVHAARRGPSEVLKFPWHAHDGLRNKLFTLHFSTWHNSYRVNDSTPLANTPWTGFYLCYYFNRCADRMSLTSTTKRTWYSGLDRDEIEWGAVGGYYDPGVLGLRRIYDWFFMIADEDRRRWVTSQGPIWSWDIEPVGEELRDPRSSQATIVWHVDPTYYGWKGTVGTPVPVRDISERRYMF
ncbi:hypothetical protein F4781DRAFT_134385 [Annulohypoxylon bovei var. microspora]|nr:hypothetical protein F4781DRAFT_134385 [Annulohypoxylon bovei var. microspora]